MTIRKTLLSAAAVAATLALSTLGASAAVVCAGNVCWHTQETYVYPPEAGVIVRPDGWQWGPNEKYAWREHPGRGYWRADKWIEW